MPEWLFILLTVLAALAVAYAMSEALLRWRRRRRG